MFGTGVPDKSINAFRSRPDQEGYVDWMEITTCPLVEIDGLSPRFNSGWLVDIYDGAQALGSKFPDHWMIQDPTPVHMDLLALFRAESESSSMWRAEKKEDW